MYAIEFRKHVVKLLAKLKKKDNPQFEAVRAKLRQVAEDPHRFKPLRTPMQNRWRVQVGSFVVVYSIDNETRIVIVEEYDHHDNAYR